MATATTGTTRATKRPNPRDYSGKVKAEAEAAVADQIEERAAEMAMLTEVRTAEKTKVVDYTKTGSPVPGSVVASAPRLSAEVEEVVEVQPTSRTIWVNSRIEDMTFGREVVREASIDASGNHIPAVLGNMKYYNFEEGTPYEVPLELAVHLERLGYLR